MAKSPTPGIPNNLSVIKPVVSMPAKEKDKMVIMGIMAFLTVFHLRFIDIVIFL